jgi:hypothetical protein
MVFVAMFDLDFLLSAMVLWNDGHKSILKGKCTLGTFL